MAMNRRSNRQRRPSGFAALSEPLHIQRARMAKASRISEAIRRNRKRVAALLSGPAEACLSGFLEEAVRDWRLTGGRTEFAGMPDDAIAKMLAKARQRARFVMAGGGYGDRVRWRLLCQKLVVNRREVEVRHVMEEAIRQSDGRRESS